MQRIHVSFAPKGERKKEKKTQRHQSEEIRASRKEISIGKRLVAPEESGFTEVEIDQTTSLEPFKAAFHCDFGGESETADRINGTLKISGPAVMLVEQLGVLKTPNRVHVPIDEHSKYLLNSFMFDQCVTRLTTIAQIWQREFVDRLVLRLVLETQQQDMVFWGVERGRSALTQLCKFMAQKRHDAKLKCLADKAARQKQKEQEEDG